VDRKENVMTVTGCTSSNRGREEPPSNLDEYYTTHLKGESFRLPKRYTVDRIIGKGSYGVVVAGRDLTTGEGIAIKKNKSIFPCASLPSEARQQQNQPAHCRSVMSQKRILRELKILLHVTHATIISIKDVFKPDSYDSFTDLYFVTDLMEADLRDIISSEQHLTDEHIQYFMFQILLAVNYMHSANILHRDIKVSFFNFKVI
jgi:serine/threonine protein kinase